MLYYFLYQFLYQRHGTEPNSPYFYKALNVFQYVTFRTAFAAITALLRTSDCSVTAGRPNGQRTATRRNARGV